MTFEDIEQELAPTHHIKVVTTYERSEGVMSVIRRLNVRPHRSRPHRDSHIAWVEVDVHICRKMMVTPIRKALNAADRAATVEIKELGHTNQSSPAKEPVQ